MCKHAGPLSFTSLITSGNHSNGIIQKTAHYNASCGKYNSSSYPIKQPLENTVRQLVRSVYICFRLNHFISLLLRLMCFL